jgi:pantetheine-phosphate adenylyltransferase
MCYEAACQWEGQPDMKGKKIAVYPGTFDPITNGHCDVVWRGLKLFDEIIVAIAKNGSKDPLFTVEERLEMVRKTFEDVPNIEVDSFDGLLVDYVVHRGADTILRGLRAVSDFEYEFQLGLMNRKLNKDVQTVFLMTGLRWIFISSSIIKEAARFGGNTQGMVPDIVHEKLKERFSKG